MVVGCSFEKLEDVEMKLPVKNVLRDFVWRRK